jgi:hypothetical protein
MLEYLRVHITTTIAISALHAYDFAACDVETAAAASVSASVTAAAAAAATSA